MDMLMDVYFRGVRIMYIIPETEDPWSYSFIPSHLSPMQAHNQALPFPDVTPKCSSVMGCSSIPSFGKLHVTFLTLTLTDPKMNLDLVLLKRNVLNVTFFF